MAAFRGNDACPKTAAAAEQLPAENPSVSSNLLTALQILFIIFFKGA